jgi:serine protease Do
MRALSLTITACSTLLIAPHLAAQSIKNLSQGNAVKTAYADTIQRANKSVVEILVDGESRALGTVVAPDLVVTKYSELTRKVAAEGNLAKIICLRGKFKWPATQVGFDRPSDLALLRLTGAKLPPIKWQLQVPKPGAFLASPDGSKLPFGVGILAAAPYIYTRDRAFLGVRFANVESGPAKLEDAVAHGAARAAGIRGGDTVVKFDDHEINSSQDLREQIGQCKPGDKVQVTVKRGDEEHTFEVILGTNNSARESGQEDVWGKLSEVRSGFQQVIQHDTIIQPDDCGGPVVDLSGDALGVNIARAGRVETLALPAKVVQELVAKILSAKRDSKEAKRPPK